MNEQEKICVRCGQTYSEGQNFCSNCGMYVGSEEQNGYFAHRAIEKEYAPEPMLKPKRKTYKANKIASLVFAILNIILALAFWLCAIISEEVSYMLYYDKSIYDVNSTEYMLSEISDIYYILAGAGYCLTILFAVGSVISWLMFFIYSKKRRTLKKELKCGALEDELKDLNVEVQEVTEEVTEEEQI